MPAILITTLFSDKIKVWNVTKYINATVAYFCFVIAVLLGLYLLIKFLRENYKSFTFNWKTFKYAYFIFIAAFFARALLVASPIANLINFMLFGLGLGFPLLVLSIISGVKGNAMITWLAKNKRLVNLTAGIIMLGISIYYLFFVFKIFG